MTKKTVKDIAASIQARLMQKAKSMGIDPNEMWQRYAMERFLYRLGLSPYRDSYILKGALLFHVWSDEQHRSTRDMDFLGHGDPSISHVKMVIKEICQQSVPEPDGLDFDSESVQGSKIKEDQEYEGVRLKFKATLGKIPILLQVDVGFGDAVTEDVKLQDFPVFLDLPAPQIKTYPKETVIAEKFQAMVALDMANSRLKDFYDVWCLSQLYAFDGEKLFHAIYNTFKRRQTPIPAELPTAFTAKFIQAKEKEWQAFVKKHRLDAGITLEKIVEGLSPFLMPVLFSLRSYQPYEWHWQAAKIWVEPQKDEEMIINEFKQNVKEIIAALKSQEIVQLIDKVIQNNKIDTNAFGDLLGESMQGYGSVSFYPEKKKMIAVLDEASCYTTNQLPKMIVGITQQAANANFKAVFTQHQPYKGFYMFHKHLVMTDKLSGQFLGETEEIQHEQK